ncbi:MAG: hypothetical protein ABIB79_04665 [archaeon]
MKMIQIQKPHVIREFSKTAVKLRELITIALYVKIQGDESFYALEEFIPESFKVIDADRGKTPNPNVLKWAVIENAKSKTYIYVLDAPSQEGEYNFKGQYMFEGMKTPKDILGESRMVVQNNNS